MLQAESLLLCILVKKITNKKSLKNSKPPPYEGSKKKIKTHYKPKMKIIGLGCLMAQMKRHDTLIATQKTLTLCDVRLLKKSRKTPKNYYFSKNDHFGGFFLIFSAMVHCTELRFFALQSVRPGASFKLSNSPKQ